MNIPRNIMKSLEKLRRKTNYWATPIYNRLPSWCFPIHQLKCKAYCVGMAKTGTVTMHIMFSKNYRTAHEAESRFLINKILAFAHGKISQGEFTRYVKHRDRRLGLEMDSSNFNYFLLDILVSEFSDAKFILTIRDCYSWLDSLINHYFARPMLRDKHWSKKFVMRLNALRYEVNGFEHAKEEKVLADNGLYTIDGYFSYWMEHNSKILSTVPEDRLLVIKTREIDQSIPKIENFLKITPGSLSKNVHGNVGSKKFHLLSQIDKDFLEEKANTHCKPLMEKYFPEITGYLGGKK